MGGKMKLSDYIVTFLQKKGIRHFFGYQGTMIAHLVDPLKEIRRQRIIPVTMNRGQLSQPADMHRRRKNVPAPMLPADLELSIF